MSAFIKISVDNSYFKALQDAVQDWEHPADLLTKLIDWEHDWAQVISSIHSNKGCLYGKEADPAELLSQLRDYFSPNYEYREKRMWEMLAIAEILSAAHKFIDWVRDRPTDNSQPD